MNRSPPRRRAFMASTTPWSPASPLFADVWPRFNAFLGQAVVIGHTVGFDLAVLKRECDLAGLPWTRPRTLDTRLLAQIAAPELAGYALEKLAAWLGYRRRRPAFRPRRRDNDGAGVSGAGAEAARPRHPHRCRGRTGLPRAHLRARRSGAGGWIEAVEAPARADAERTLKRFDSYAYRHRNRDIMRMPPVFVESDTVGPRRARATGAARRYRPSMCAATAAAGGVKAAEAGIVTERDLLRAIAPVRRRRARSAGRADHEPAARGGSGGRLRLSRHRPHEPSQDPPSRCRR